MLIAHLRRQGIGALIHYPVPAHLQPAYRGRLIVPAGGLPHTEETARRIVSLSMHPALQEKEVLETARCVADYFRAASDPPADR